jgi:hypothetical protein
VKDYQSPVNGERWIGIGPLTITAIGAGLPNAGLAPAMTAK